MWVTGAGVSLIGAGRGATVVEVQPERHNKMAKEYRNTLLIPFIMYTIKWLKQPLFSDSG